MISDTSTTWTQALGDEERSGPPAELDRLLLEASTSLIDVPPESTDEVIADVLAAIAPRVGAERAHVLIDDQAGAEAADLPRDRTIGWDAPGLAALDPRSLADLVSGEAGGRLAGGGLPSLVWPALLLPVRAEGRLLGQVVLLAGPHADWDEDLASALSPLGEMVARALASQRRTAAISASLDNYHRAVHDVRDVIVRFDGNGKVTFVNRAWTELTGLTVEQTLDRDAFETIHPDDHAIAATHIAAAVAGEDASPRSVRFIAADGSYRWMEVRGRALFDANGSFDGLSGVLHDVTERRLAEDRVHRALEDAVAARDEAQRSDEAKSRFLSRVSHELRTPLNAILGFAQLLEYTALDADGADSVRLIREAGGHLLSLINDVMDLSRIQTGELDLVTESVAVDEVWSECAEFLELQASRLRVEVAVASTAGVRVLVDRLRFKQVVLNLLSNAIKYNRPGGTVTVSVRPWVEDGRDQVLIEITDTGVGVAEDQLEDMFSAFTRIGEDDADIEGTGIGLTLSRSMVEAMGGEISARSRAGVGTTISLTLPAAPESSG